MMIIASKWSLINYNSVNIKIDNEPLVVEIKYLWFVINRWLTLNNRDYYIVRRISEKIYFLEWHYTHSKVTYWFLCYSNVFIWCKWSVSFDYFLFKILQRISSSRKYHKKITIKSNTISHLDVNDMTDISIFIL